MRTGAFRRKKKPIPQSSSDEPLRQTAYPENRPVDSFSNRGPQSIASPTFPACRIRCSITQHTDDPDSLRWRPENYWCSRCAPGQELLKSCWWEEKSTSSKSDPAPQAQSKEKREVV